MIRPSYRLIQMGLLACIVMIVGFAYSNHYIALLLPFAVFIFVMVLDLYLSMHIGYGLKLELPNEIRGFSEKNFSIDLMIINELEHDYLVKIVYKDVPWAKEIREETFFTALKGKSKINISGIFAPRGKYIKGVFALIYHSRLSLWEYAKEMVLEGENKVIVYPSYTASRKKLVMQLHTLQLIGSRQKRQIGKGKDFERLREYMPGDCYDDIYWKATAKRGFPVSKVYQIEKTQELYLAIDCSRLSGKAYLEEDNTPKYILEKFLETAFLLGEHCIKNGDKFGLIIFSDSIQKFIKAKSGNDHLRYCKEILYNLRPSEVAPDYHDVIAEIFEKVVKRSLVVFLLNLDDLVESEDFVNTISYITRKHLVYAQMLRTPDIEPLYSREVKSLQEISDSVCKHLKWSQLMQIKQKLKLKGVEFSLSDNSVYTANTINHYMQIKQKQAI